MISCKLRQWYCGCGFGAVCFRICGENDGFVSQLYYCIASTVFFCDRTSDICLHFRSGTLQRCAGHFASVVTIGTYRDRSVFCALSREYVVEAQLRASPLCMCISKLFVSFARLRQRSSVLPLVSLLLTLETIFAISNDQSHGEGDWQARGRRRRFCFVICPSVGKSAAPRRVFCVALWIRRSIRCFEYLSWVA